MGKSIDHAAGIHLQNSPPKNSLKFYLLNSPSLRCGGGQGDSANEFEWHGLPQPIDYFE